MTANLAARIDAYPPQDALYPGGRISWREAGRGIPVVLLHGISSSSASWLQQLETWSQRFRVVAWDAPGYGASTALPMTAPRAAEYAKVLKVLADRIARPFHLVGHSLGALVAGAFAKAFPDDIVSLALLNPALGYGSAPESTRRTVLAQRLEQMQRLGPSGLARERASALVSDRASRLAVELLQWSAQRLSVAGYGQAVHLLATGDLLADLASVSKPLLVLTGSEDRITPAGSAAAVARACPAAHFVSLPGVGHASHVEDPEGVAAAYLAFYSAHDRASMEGAA